MCVCHSQFYFYGVKFIRLFLHDFCYSALTWPLHLLTPVYTRRHCIKSPGHTRDKTEPRDTGHVRRSQTSLTGLNLSVPAAALCLVSGVRLSKVGRVLRLKPAVQGWDCIGPTEEMLFGKCQVASEVKWLWSLPQVTLKGKQMES